MSDDPGKTRYVLPCPFTTGVILPGSGFGLKEKRLETGAKRRNVRGERRTLEEVQRYRW